MKKFIIVLTLFLFGLNLHSFAQKQFVNMIAGYSTLSPNSDGYFLHADYTRRLLWIFRTGLGISSNSFMHYNNGFLSHENNLDLEAKLGLGLKIIGFRIEAGLGLAARYWFRSYSTDSATYHSFTLQNHTISLQPGQIQTFKYISFGGLSYLSVGVDVNDWLGLKGYAQFKNDKFGDKFVNLGAGIYFIIK